MIPYHPFAYEFIKIISTESQVERCLIAGYTVNG